MRSWVPGRSFAWCRRLATAWCSVSLTRVDLPEPETPVTQQKTPSGKAASTCLRLCWPAPRTISSPFALRRLAGTSIRRLPARYWPVSEAGSAIDLGRRALGDHVAAVLTGAGAEVEQVVRGAHRALVVLDHDHRVAEIAKALQGADQLLVVALVQPDRGLVEDVHDPDEAGADLRRQADPLRLPARERSRRAPQREVADAHVLQEGEALGDLAHDEARDRALRLGHLQRGDPLPRGPCGHLRELGDADPADLHREALRAEAGAAAVRARLLGHVALDPLPHPLGVRLLVAALQVVDDALEADRVAAAAAEAVAVADRVPLRAGAVEEDLAVCLRQLLPGLRDVDVVGLGHRLDDPLPIARMAEAPWLQRALLERERRIGDDQLGVDDPLEAESVAALAGAVRRVEGEDPRLQLGDRGAAAEAGEALRKQQHSPLSSGAGRRELNLDQAAGERPGGLHRLREAAAQVRLHHEAVDDDRDVVLELLVEGDLLVEPAQLAVHDGARVALEPHLLEQLPVLALAAPHHGGEDEEACGLLEGSSGGP